MSKKRISFYVDDDNFEWYRSHPHLTKAFELNEVIRRGIGRPDINGEDAVHLWMIVRDLLKDSHQMQEHIEHLENCNRIMMRVIAPLMETPINEEHSPDDMIGK